MTGANREMAPQRVESAALVGAGKQGWYHLEMLWHQLPQLSEIRVADARREAADDIVARARKIGIPAVAVDTPTDAVRNADVVLTITPSNTPLFAADAISDNTLVCGVGATKYDRCEIGADRQRRRSQTPVATMRTSTSPAAGPARSSVSIFG